MGIYPKKLNSITEVEREKKELQKSIKRLNENGFFSSTATAGKKKGKKEEKDGTNSLLGLLPFSNPVVDIVVKMISRKLTKPAPGKEKAYPTEPSPIADKIKKTTKMVAVEVITGFLKWKAIELSYKGIQYLIKKRKEERALRELEEPEARLHATK